MADRIVYAICDDSCKFETMTKEQILTAIEQALAQGYVADPDSAVFSKIKEIRANEAVQIWKGTEAQFNALDPAPSVGKAVVRVGTDGVLYLCTDDTTFDILNQVEDVRRAVEDHAESKNNPHGVTAEQVGAAEKDHTHTPASIGAAAASHTHTPASIGAAAASHTHSNYVSTVTTTGSGNAVTAISQSGNTITATKGSSFATASHTHTLEKVCLWSGEAPSGTTITLSESIWNFPFVYVAINYKETALTGLIYGASAQRGFATTIVNEDKSHTTYAASITFSKTDPTTAVVDKCIYITHTGGSNHTAAGEANVHFVYGVKVN